MIIFKPVEKIERVIDKVLCNKCGKNLEARTKGAFYEGIEFRIENEDGSDHCVPPGTQMHLCDDCYTGFLITLKFKPEIYHG